MVQQLEARDVRIVMRWMSCELVALLLIQMIEGKDWGLVLR